MSIHRPSLAYTWPLLVILSLVISYITAPRFFVTYIFQAQEREFQLVEIMTFLAAAIAGMVLLVAAWKFWHWTNYWSAGLVGIIAIACLFFAGEEISWGQSYLQWSTPTWWKTHFSGETNLHNSRLPIHLLAGLFIFGIFFLLPALWTWRARLPLPKELEPAIPEGPVIWAIGIAIVFRECKGLYRQFSPLWYREVDIPWVESHDKFYQQFLWGVNEYRELLVALALLLYASYRLAAAQSLEKTQTS